jgi:hypothetical protein
MKRSFFLFLILSHFWISNAQEVTQNVYAKEPKWDLGLMGGWMFAGNDGYGKVKNNFVFSPSIAYLYRENLHVELSANFLSSQLTYKSTSTAPERTIPFSQMYITGGLIKIFNVNSPVLQPYSLATIGGLYRSSSSSTNPNQWQFAVGLAFGLKYMMSTKVGLRAQARLQSSVNGIGLGVGVGTGGVSTGVGTYGTYLQFDLSGGLFIRL